MGKLSLDVNAYLRDVNNFADDDLLLNTPVSLPIALRKAQIYGAEDKVNIPRWGHLPGFVSYSYIAVTQLTGRFWVSQDQRNTVRTRLRYPFLPRLWGAVGAEYGSGLRVDFDAPTKKRSQNTARQ